MEFCTVILASLVLLLLLAVRHLRKNRGYLETLGIPLMKPSFLMGSYNFAIHKIQFHKEQMKWLETYGKTYGLYEGVSPVLVTIDPEIVKSVVAKNFDSFTDTFDFPVEDRHMTLDLSKGELWKVLRKNMSPTFSSGKLKAMMEPMERVANQLKAHLDEQILNGNGNDLDMKKIFISVSLEAISQCAFGISNDSFGNQDSELAKQGEAVFAGLRSDGYGTDAFFNLFNHFPWLANVIPQFPEAYDKLAAIARDILKNRKQNGIVKNDFLQRIQELLDEVESGESKDPEVLRLLNEKILLAQCVIFFVAGHETTANTMTTLCHNLVLNEDVQARIVEDILEAMDSHGGQINYASVEAMKYLEAAINENLRMNGPAILHARTCVKDCEVKPGLVIRKGMRVDLPIYASHHNPDFFPDPEEFRPERFLKENEQDIIPYTFRAFGGGNRFCIGQRFAMVEMKTAMAHLLSNFKISKSPNTKLDFFKGDQFLLSYQDMKINIQKR